MGVTPNVCEFTPGMERECDGCDFRLTMADENGVWYECSEYDSEAEDWIPLPCEEEYAA